MRTEEMQEGRIERMKKECCPKMTVYTLINLRPTESYVVFSMCVRLLGGWK